MTPQHGQQRGGLTRRRLLGLAGGGALGMAVGGSPLGTAVASAAPPGVVGFHGAHQAGILTPQQGRIVLAAFDLDLTAAADLAALLRTWTDAAARMSTGLPAVPEATSATLPPADPGEAVGLSASRLTITVGLGPGAFGTRLGLAARRPAPLAKLPALPGERLDAARSGGHLCVQACADDPQVAFHAVHSLAHLGRGAVTMRWLQTGFLQVPGGAGSHATPRNLQGFRDGTNNLRAHETAALRRHLWVGAEERQAWLRGGTYMVVRRIRMHTEAWDRSPLAQQEGVIGRHKASGAPLGRTRERDPLDLGARKPDGMPIIPFTSHVRLAAPATNEGIRMLRRGYSFVDGADPATGAVDAGLLFICFVRNPQQFITVQRRLGTGDALNDFIEHRSSAVFAIPPGVRPGGFLADGLFRA